MKAKMFFLIVLLFLSNSFMVMSQDRGPTQQNFTKCNNQSFKICGTDTDFKQSNFLLGWMWHSRATISDALFMNQHDPWNDDPLSYYSNGENICMKNHDNSHFLFTNHGQGDGYLCARSMMYKADLLIPVNVDYSTIANQCKTDTNQNASIFGFKSINPFANKTGSSLDLDTNRFHGRSLIMQHPWQIEIIKTF
jgi:hypothetical protein